MRKHTKLAATLLATAGLTLAAGCSIGDQKVEGEGTVTNSGAYGKDAAKAATTATWKFKTEDGCKGTIKQVKPDDDKLLSQVQRVTGKKIHAMKADIDWRGASSSEKSSNCSVTEPRFTLVNQNSGASQEPVDVDDMLGDSNAAIDVQNKMVDSYNSGKPGAKGTNYIIFDHKINPFTDMQLEPTQGSDKIHAEQN